MRCLQKKFIKMIETNLEYLDLDNEHKNNSFYKF